MKSFFIWIYIAFLFILFFLLTIPVFLVTWPFDKYRKAANKVFMSIGYFMIRPVVTSIESVGLEHFEEGVPTICIANHQSFMDMPLLATLPWKMKWLSKKEMFYIPVVGWLMYMTGHISINRQKGAKALGKLTAAIPYIKDGNPLMIFPEGTRSKDGKIKAFKRGAFSLAFENNFRVLPIVLHGTHDLLPSGDWVFKKRIPVKLEVLSPIEAKDFNSWEELMDFSREKMLACQA